MSHLKIKIFDTEAEALELADQIATAIGDGSPYINKAMHNHVTGKYATKLRLVYEAQIVSVIGQAEFDNAIEINHADPEWNVQKRIYSPI